MLHRYKNSFITMLLVAILLISGTTIAEEQFDTGIWTIDAYVDEFDLPTDEYYIVSNLISGTFTNAVATKENLSAYLYYGLDYQTRLVWFRLLPYGNTVEKNPFDATKNYNIVVMDNNGEKYSMSGFMFPQSDLLYVNYNGGGSGKTDAELLCKILTQGGTVRISISEDDNSLVKYVLTIEDAAGFANAQSKFIEKELVTCGLSLGEKINHSDYGEGVVSSFTALWQTDHWAPYIYADFADGTHGFYEIDVTNGVVTKMD